MAITGIPEALGLASDYLDRFTTILKGSGMTNHWFAKWLCMQRRRGNEEIVALLGTMMHLAPHMTVTDWVDKAHDGGCRESHAETQG